MEESSLPHLWLLVTQMLLLTHLWVQGGAKELNPELMHSTLAQLWVLQTYFLYRAKSSLR